MGEPPAGRPGEHPAPRVLERFMRGEVRPEERRRVVRHLLAGCERCVAMTRRLWALGDATSWLAGPKGERRQAPRLLAELLRHPASHRLSLVCDEERFRNPAVAELLTAQSRETAARDAVLALQLAELAVALTARLDAEHQGWTVLRGIAARAWTQLGDARRLNADLAGADRALARAAVLGEDGAGEPLERAELLAIQAELRWQQGRAAEAERLVERAAGLCRTAANAWLLARLLLRQCDFLDAGGKRDAALGAVSEAVAVLDELLSASPVAASAPGLLALALHRLAELLAGAGRHQEARAAAARAALLYERVGEVPNRSRLWRLTGTLEAALGHGERAEAALLTARQRLWRAGLGREAALALLDLALLFAEQGRSAELGPVAEDLLEVLSGKDLQKRGELLIVMFQRVVDWGSEADRLSFCRAMSCYLSALPAATGPAPAPLRLAS